MSISSTMTPRYGPQAGDDLEIANLRFRVGPAVRFDEADDDIATRPASRRPSFSMANACRRREPLPGRCGERRAALRVAMARP